jgi:hypothetical protein
VGVDEEDELPGRDFRVIFLAMDTLEGAEAEAGAEAGAGAGSSPHKMANSSERVILDDPGIPLEVAILLRSSTFNPPCDLDFPLHAFLSSLISIARKNDILLKNMYSPRTACRYICLLNLILSLSSLAALLFGHTFIERQAYLDSYKKDHAEIIQVDSGQYRCCEMRNCICKTSTANSTCASMIEALSSGECYFTSPCCEDGKKRWDKCYREVCHRYTRFGDGGCSFEEYRCNGRCVNTVFNRRCNSYCSYCYSPFFEFNFTYRGEETKIRLSANCSIDDLDCVASLIGKYSIGDLIPIVYKKSDRYDVIISSEIPPWKVDNLSAVVIFFCVAFCLVSLISGYFLYRVAPASPELAPPALALASAPPAVALAPPALAPPSAIAIPI